MKTYAEEYYNKEHLMNADIQYIATEVWTPISNIKSELRNDFDDIEDEDEKVLVYYNDLNYYCIDPLEYEWCMGSSVDGDVLLLKEYHHDCPTGHNTLIVGITDEDYEELKYIDWDFAMEFAKEKSKSLIKFPVSSFILSSLNSKSTYPFSIAVIGGNYGNIQNNMWHIWHDINLHYTIYVCTYP